MTHSDFYATLLAQSIDPDPMFDRVADDNFWDLIEVTETRAPNVTPMI